MKTSNRLFYSATKSINFYGKSAFINVEVRLGDDCKNGHCDFSMTGEIYYNTKNQYGTQRHTIICGCIHEEIVKHFPKMQIFANLHLHNSDGQPMHAVEKGFYWAHTKQNLKILQKEFMLTDDEAIIFMRIPDKLMFAYKLVSMGIVARWKREAETAIEILEKLTDTKWENPYEEYKPIISSDEEEECKKRINENYYTPEAIEIREKKERWEKSSKLRAKIIEECDNTTEKAIANRDVKLSLIDFGIVSDNYIYYDHSNTLKFNWLDYREKIPTEQIEAYINSVDKNNLPKGIKFVY